MKNFKKSAEKTAEKHKEIQSAIASKDSKAKKSEAVPKQTGARKYPIPPMPGKKLTKPGNEKDLTLEPMYNAPFYKGSEKLKDHVAIITGGDSGIGRSVAILFAREGSDVVVVYLNEHEDASDTKKLVEAEGKRCHLISGDVSDRDFCFAVAKETLNEFGRIDVLVNNAAFQLHVPDFEDLSAEHFDLTMKTNLYGYFHMAQAVIPHMKAGSSIVNSGSVTGLLGSRNLIDYSLTKGGIHTFTRSLGTHLVNKGIRVNAVAPGPVWTPLNPADKKQEDIKKFGEKTPMGRPAQPEEIAPAYVFLASPHCSSYITGEVIPIIGGYSGG